MNNPSILIFGNCQGEHIGEVARYMPSLRERFDIKIVALHLVTPQDWETRFTPAFFEGVQVVWNQVESGEPSEHRKMLESRIPRGCQIVTYPPLSMLCLWPFSGADPRQAERTDDVYPWADSIAASLAGEDLTDDALFERYMRLSTEKMPDLTRRLRIDAMRGRATDGLADIQMWDWVEANFRSRRLFYTSSHLTALPVAHLLTQLLERTACLTATAILRAKQEMAFLLRRYRGQDVEMVPIHPLVAERLELTWYDPDERHRWHGHAWTYREYLSKYIRWEPYLR